jgi:hypothetical protein
LNKWEAEQFYSPSCFVLLYQAQQSLFLPMKFFTQTGPLTLFQWSLL